MTRGRTLAIVQAGGTGGRMDVLTRECAKPALPFAGVYQLVDFPLSNLSHSGIDDVWLSVQFQAGSLQKQVANGRPWDLDRNIGGFRLLLPEEGTGSPDEQGFASGNADELFRIRDDIAAQQPDLLIVCSADHVYRFDFSDAIATHRRKEAECTVVTSQVPRDEAGDHATVVSNRLGRVTDFAYKPSRPRTGTVATEIFVYEPEVLFDVLGELHRERTGKASPEETGLGDFGDHLLPALVERGRVFEHPMPGYWRDVGKPLKYLAAHRDLLTADVGLFDDPRWPILSQQPQLAPARIHESGQAEDCLVSPGVQLHGAARRSVLGPGVVVEEGACVEDSVIFADVVVGSGAVVAWSIVDSGCRVLSEAKVGEQWSGDDPDDDRIVLMGRDCSVAAGQSVPAGSRLEPGTTV
jgi:glucose-1-phosphate adenylyltransferase